MSAFDALLSEIESPHRLTGSKKLMSHECQDILDTGRLTMGLYEYSFPYPSPVINTNKRANFLSEESCNLNTPEMGKSKMKISDTTAHAANGTKSLWPTPLCDVCKVLSQVYPNGGASSIIVARVQAM